MSRDECDTAETLARSWSAVR